MASPLGVARKLPAGGSFGAGVGSYRQICLPVRASRANVTDPLVAEYRTPLTTIGVPGALVGPVYGTSYHHASPNRPTLEASICVRGLCRVSAASRPYVGHSPDL